MRNDTHLTSGYEPVLERQIRKTRVGMASWAAGGPFGTTCGQCAHFGYYQQIRNVAGNVVNTKFTPRLLRDVSSLDRSTWRGDWAGTTESCRYFRRREQENAR